MKKRYLREVEFYRYGGRIYADDETVIVTFKRSYKFADDPFASYKIKKYSMSVAKADLLLATLRCADTYATLQDAVVSLNYIYVRVLYHV